MRVFTVLSGWVAAARTFLAWRISAPSCWEGRGDVEEDGCDVLAGFLEDVEGAKYTGD